jgi:hypothetical protein
MARARLVVLVRPVSAACSGPVSAAAGTASPLDCPRCELGCQAWLAHGGSAPPHPCLVAPLPRYACGRSPSSRFSRGGLRWLRAVPAHPLPPRGRPGGTNPSPARRNESLAAGRAPSVKAPRAPLGAGAALTAPAPPLESDRRLAGTTGWGKGHSGHRGRSRWSRRGSLPARLATRAGRRCGLARAAASAQSGCALGGG